MADSSKNFSIGIQVAGAPEAAASVRDLEASLEGLRNELAQVEKLQSELGVNAQATLGNEAQRLRDQIGEAEAKLRALGETAKKTTPELEEIGKVANISTRSVIGLTGALGQMAGAAVDGETAWGGITRAIRLGGTALASINPIAAGTLVGLGMLFEMMEKDSSKSVKKMEDSFKAVDETVKLYLADCERVNKEDFAAHIGALEKFKQSWKAVSEATKLEQGFDDKSADLATRRRKAELDLEEQNRLSAATSDEERERIKRDFAHARAGDAASAAREKASREDDHAQQDLLNLYKQRNNLDTRLNAAKEAVDKTKWDPSHIVEGLAQKGIYSDQARQLAELRDVQQRLARLQQMKNQMERLGTPGPGVSTAEYNKLLGREESDRKRLLDLSAIKRQAVSDLESGNVSFANQTGLSEAQKRALQIGEQALKDAHQKHEIAMRDMADLTKERSAIDQPILAGEAHAQQAREAFHISQTEEKAALGRDANQAAAENRSDIRAGNQAVLQQVTQREHDAQRGAEQAIREAARTIGTHGESGKAAAQMLLQAAQHLSGDHTAAGAHAVIQSLQQYHSANIQGIQAQIGAIQQMRAEMEQLHQQIGNVARNGISP